MQRVTVSMLGVVLLGAGAGLIAGFYVGRFAQKLLFEVKVTDAQMMAPPILLLLGAALLAALPPAIRATRIDPADTLRGE